MEQFRAGLSRRVPFVPVPNFDTDLLDLASLARMHAHLFAPGAASEKGGPVSADGSSGSARKSRSRRRSPTPTS